MAEANHPVLILGAGVNGAAIARELALNGMSVVMVDNDDICSGASASSSRLIHGGLRYLEFAEFDLVRESLAERGRLLELAPQFVRPLRLFIPVSGRLGGWLAASQRFLGIGKHDRPPKRGMWLVRMGLWMYDRYARDPHVPKHALCRVGDKDAVPVDPAMYRWLCSYYDAQMLYPERFVVALLEDARRIAASAGEMFRVLTHYEARLDGDRAIVRPIGSPDATPVLDIQVSAVINATGAWVDHTLEQLEIPSERLMGGTKGSHFVTYHAGLRDALAGRGIYMEAEDGRPVFILPLASAVLVGTTDEHYDDDPRTAVASEDELNYLVGTVQKALPQVGLSHDDVAWHYSGVRPLPYVAQATPASVTRGHRLQEHTSCSVPMYSVVGGKLTTCRSLAETTTATVLGRLGRSASANSRERAVPGAESFPSDPAAVNRLLDDLAGQCSWSRQQLAALWPLYGTRLMEIIENVPAKSAGRAKNIAGGPASELENLHKTHLPVAWVRWVIEHEWVTTLDDLVERRLMLLYHREFTQAALRQAAEVLVAADKLAADRIDAEIADTVECLVKRHGRRVSAATSESVTKGHPR